MFLYSNMIKETIEDYCKTNDVKFTKMEYRELTKIFCKKRKPVPAKFADIIDILDDNHDSFICCEVHII